MAAWQWCQAIFAASWPQASPCGKNPSAMQQCFHARLSRLVSFRLSLQVLRADCVARDVVAAAALPPLPAAEGANSQPPPVCIDCGCAMHMSRSDCRQIFVRS